MNSTFWREVHRITSRFDKLNPIVRTIVGIGMILLGITGIILPIMPGWVFLIPGAVLVFPFTKKWFKK